MANRNEFRKLGQMCSLLHVVHNMLHDEDGISKDNYDKILPVLDNAIKTTGGLFNEVSEECERKEKK